MTWYLIAQRTSCPVVPARLDERSEVIVIPTAFRPPARVCASTSSCCHVCNAYESVSVCLGGEGGGGVKGWFQSVHNRSMRAWTRPFECWLGSTQGSRLRRGGGAWPTHATHRLLCARMARWRGHMVRARAHGSKTCACETVQMSYQTGGGGDLRTDARATPASTRGVTASARPSSMARTLQGEAVMVACAVPAGWARSAQQRARGGAPSAVSTITRRAQLCACGDRPVQQLRPDAPPGRAGSVQRTPHPSPTQAQAGPGGPEDGC